MSIYAHTSSRLWVTPSLDLMPFSMFFFQWRRFLAVQSAAIRKVRRPATSTQTLRRPLRQKDLGQNGTDRVPCRRGSAGEASRR